MPKKSKNGRAAFMRALNEAKRQKVPDEAAEPAAEARREACAGSDDGAPADDTEKEDDELYCEMEEDVVVCPEVVEVFRGVGVEARRQADRERQRRSRGSRACVANSRSLSEMFGWVVPAASVDCSDKMFAPASEEAVEEGASVDEASRPPLRPNGKPRGRPPRSDTPDPRDDGARAASSAASHGGLKPGAHGKPRVNKGERASLRKAASVAAARMRGECSTRSDEEHEAPTQRSHAGLRNGPQVLRTQFTTEMSLRLRAIASRRHFIREDIQNGMNIAREQWARVSTDPWELRRAYAMAHFARLRCEDVSIADALQIAAEGVLLGDEGNFEKTVCANTIRSWLSAFVSQGGQIVLSNRGRHAKTESYLSDENIREAAREWLSERIAASRKKGQEKRPPLTIELFQKWCNDSLLANIISQPNSEREPISSSTAWAWMQQLGFKYCEHRKTIYVDGHERSDVTSYRRECCVILKVMREVLVTFGGADCERVVWPSALHPGERPVVAVSQDESAFHANDDCSHEWVEEGKGMSLKSKSRGSLLMVSEFLSELHGRLGATRGECQEYAVAHPTSLIAEKMKDPKFECDCRVLLEPGAGAGKDAYFDAQQLMSQFKLARELFDASHFAPARDVPMVSESRPVAVAVVAERDTVRVDFSMHRAGVKHLPKVGCTGLFLFDHSSGHGAKAADARNVAYMNKGPDWTGKVPWMRDGFYFVSPGRTVVHPLQFQEGDVLACDIVCPVGIDPSRPAATPAPSRLVIQPHQLFGRSITMAVGMGSSQTGRLAEPPPGLNVELVVHFSESSFYSLTVEEALSMLVGPPPHPEQFQEGPPTEDELQCAVRKYLAGRRQTLAKHHKNASSEELRRLADEEWAGLPEGRRLHFVAKVREEARAKAARLSSLGVAPGDRVLRRGSPVPPVLWGRNKGMEIILAERGMLNSNGLKACCASVDEHRGGAKDPHLNSNDRPVDSGLATVRRRNVCGEYVMHLRNNCCCKRLLSAQEDFRCESSALERLVTEPIVVQAREGQTVRVPWHLVLFLPKFHCELNWIERYWGAAKRFARANCDYSLVGLRQTMKLALSQRVSEIPEDMRGSTDLPVAPLLLQRRHARISWQYWAEYAKGPRCANVVKAVAEKRSARHRDTSDRRSRQAEAAMEVEAFAMAM